jgi:hypothetical protein
MHDEYGDMVPSFTERWREAIDAIVPYVENPQEELDRTLSELSLRLEYWDYFRDLATAFPKV